MKNEFDGLMDLFSGDPVSPDKFEHCVEMACRAYCRCYGIDPDSDHSALTSMSVDMIPKLHYTVSPAWTQYKSTIKGYIVQRFVLSVFDSELSNAGAETAKQNQHQEFVDFVISSCRQIMNLHATYEINARTTLADLGMDDLDRLELIRDIEHRIITIAVDLDSDTITNWTIDVLANWMLTQTQKQKGSK